MTRRPTPLAYPPLPKAIYENLKLFMKQAKRHLDDAYAPPPDPMLLTGSLRHAHETLVPGWYGGEVKIEMGLRPHQVPHGCPLPAYFPHETMVILACLLLGGSHAYNTSARGNTIHRLFSGKHRLNVDRVLADAQDQEVIRREGEELTRTDVATVRTVEGRPTANTRNGREMAIRAALAKHRANSAKAAFALSLTGYRLLLRRAFKLHDALHLARLSRINLKQAA